MDTRQLLTDIRDYLDITWGRPEDDKKLENIMFQGIAYIDGINGKENNYEEHGQPRGLLFDYCRYARSNASEEFAINYQHELIRLQMRTEIDDYDKEQSGDV